MSKRYQSYYSNEVHQLIVSPSKHYYVTGSGAFKYQKKPFELKLENVDQAKKNHVIHYLIRDHFSGLFYSEICSSHTPIPIYAFLFRAWGKKQNHPLYGIPDFMTVPKNVQSYFPGLLGFIEKLGVTYVKVTSGFQGGVRDIRTIEDELKHVGFNFDNPRQSLKEPPFDFVLETAPEIYRRFFDSLYKKPTKTEIWLSAIEPGQKLPVPTSLEMFEDLWIEATLAKK